MKELLEKVSNIKDSCILVYGDIMVDQYINGKVSRISPEAPVPVLAVSEKKFKLGGAGNVINNVVSLGANVRVLGYVGDDSNGQWVIEHLNKKGVNTDRIEKYKNYTTITKTRLVSKNQQFLRFDEEEIRDVPQDYYEKIIAEAEQVFEGINAIIISDYGKGAVTEEVAQLIIVSAKKRGIPVIVDPKGNDYSKYRGSSICTPNMNELSIVSNTRLDSEDTIRKVGIEQRERLAIDNLVLTRSEKGITAFGAEGVKNFPAVSKDVVDVSGAGDTVVATIACMYANEISLDMCCELANMAASVVCSKFGTATCSLNELMEQVVSSGKYKYVNITTAKYTLESLREKGKKIVFTNGCFDLMHAGHLSSFVQAKSFGDVLVVAVNSDASVRRLKGEERPIIEQKYRIEMLCALECVDYVILMDDDTPISIIKELKPDITVKGKDWEHKELPEQTVVEAYGGEVKFINMEGDLSTTSIIGKIRNEKNNYS